MMCRRAAAAFLVVLGLVSAASAGEIWYGPLADMPTPRKVVVDPDYPQLFQPNAPWQRTLPRVKVFVLAGRFAQIGPEDQLRRIYAFLKENRIKLAISWGVVTATECGAQTEGINHGAGRSAQLAKRVKALGGDWAYIAADGALGAGHYRIASNRGEANGCQFPIDALAKNVAANIREIQGVFPPVKWVDDEPLTALQSEQDLDAWYAALRRELGAAAPFAMQMDVQWGKPWEDSARRVVPALQKLGIGYGLIVNGTGRDRSDEAWIASARDHLSAWERVVSIPPDFVVFTSWTDHPAHVLPESDPNTLLGLIGWYCASSKHRVGCNGAER